MKKLQLLFICLIAVFGLSTLSAQSYKAFELDILRIGYAIPSGDGLSSGIAFSSEPRYNISDQLSVGLRAEFALFGGGDDESISVGTSSSYALIGDYYITNSGNKRLFAGLGIGTFSGGDLDATVGGQTVTTEGGSSIGIVGRVGYELGILRISGEYNLITGDESSNYLGIHLGFTLFGKYKN